MGPIRPRGQRTVACTEAGRGGDRVPHEHSRAHRRLAQSEPLRQPSRNAARERTAGAVRMPGHDAWRREPFDTVNRRQQIDHLLAGRMTAFQQRVSNVSAA
jgi:hypothetical protein